MRYTTTNFKNPAENLPTSIVQFIYNLLRNYTGVTES